MIYLQKGSIIDDSGMPTKRFSAEFPREGPNVFKIELAELGHSAVYFCASSASTSVQSHVSSVHKHPPTPCPETA
jgi:hypothetical protein